MTKLVAVSYQGTKIDKAFIKQVITGEKAQRDKIQVAVIGSIIHGIENGFSADLLTNLFLGLQANGGRNLKGLLTYVTKTCSGLHFSKENNRFVFVKDKEKVVFAELEYPWYKEGKIANDNKMEVVDVWASLKAVIGKLDKVASGELKDKNIDAVKARELQGALQALEA